MAFSLDTRLKVSVTVTQTDETYLCATQESLLQGMLRLGRKGIPAGCVNGGCGVCKVRILEGQVTSLGPVSRAHVSTEEEAQGCTLACRVAPATAVRLEVAGKMCKPFSKGRAESATASPLSQQQ
ncbi:MAG: 2Fe-2S iron-sulfur cluster-binding protein [Burkholderiaceae bacterium]